MRTTESFVQGISLIPQTVVAKSSIELPENFVSLTEKQYKATALWLEYHLLKDYSLRLILKYHYADYEVLAECILAALHLAEKILVFKPTFFNPLEVIYRCELDDHQRGIEKMLCRDDMSKRHLISVQSSYWRKLENNEVILRKTTSQTPTYTQLEGLAVELSRQRITAVSVALDSYIRCRKRLTQKLKKSGLNRVLFDKDLCPYVLESRGRKEYDL